MRILQARVSGHLRAFSSSFMRKYGFTAYTTETQPAVFFGCYTGRRSNAVSPDIQAVLRHQSLAVVIWGGSDAVRITSSRYSSMLHSPRARHIAISKSISEDLLRASVPHICLPVFPSEPSRFTSAPIGSSVYVYSSHTQPVCYNESLVRQVIARLPDVKFVRGFSQAPGHYSALQMPSVYAGCFIGLRPTLHDGLPNTVIELGLMGRRCIWNGWLPNAIPWTSAGSVVRSIQKEQSKISQLTKAVLERRAERVREYLQLPLGWLDTEFYE